jgi:hypothetical protein
MEKSSQYGCIKEIYPPEIITGDLSLLRPLRGECFVYDSEKDAVITETTIVVLSLKTINQILQHWPTDMNEGANHPFSRRTHTLTL